MTTVLIWFGIIFCLIQSAMFSGLILALLGISRLRLEAEANSGNSSAKIVLALRKDANFLLTTLIWGNVSVNTLLTLLSGSILAGTGAFFFSVLGITFFGEIVPQAYFSRNALKMGALLAPVVRFYQKILYPLAKPTGWLLDRWIGPEGFNYMQENSFKFMLEKHIGIQESDISHLEGMGALNFFNLDDLNVLQEGERVDSQSIIQIPIQDGRPVFPVIQRIPTDPFLRQILISGKKWVIFTDAAEFPRFVLNVADFIRDLFSSIENFAPTVYCHRPIVIVDPETKMGEVIRQLKMYPEHAKDDVIDYDLVLYWNEEKRIITGADLLGRLLRGVVTQEKA